MNCSGHVDQRFSLLIHPMFTPPLLSILVECQEWISPSFEQSGTAQQWPGQLTSDIFPVTTQVIIRRVSWRYLWYL